MSLRLLIDEDSQGKVFLAALRSAGFDVTTVSEESLTGSPDAVVLNQAHAQGRAVLTHDADDYVELHKSGMHHSGILVIYEEPDRSRNMRFADVINALRNLERSGLDIAGEFVPLNAWDY